MYRQRFSGRTLFTLLPRWPLVLLFASVGLTAIAVYGAARTSRANRAVTERVLRDYSAFVAWAYTQHLQEALRDMAQEAIGPVNHGAALHIAPEVPSASSLPHYLMFDERCYCHRAMHGPNAEAYFAFEIASKVLDAAINTHPNLAEGWEVDRPLSLPVSTGAFSGYSPSERDTILRDVKHLARDVPDREHGYTYLTVALDRGPRVLSYTLMPTVRGDTMVYGAQYTADAFSNVLGNIMRAGNILPEAFSNGRRNADLVDISVLDQQGHLLYASNGQALSDPMAVVQMSPRFASLSVRATIKPDQAESLVVGGLPHSRLPFLLGLLALAAGLTVVAGMQLRREAELSRVRSDWIASVSHELRTPLAQIRLYVDTVRLGRAAGAEQQKWALSNVDRETTRLSHLVEKVLSFSRFGRGADSAPQPTDVASETTRIVDEFRPLGAARNVAIETDIHATPAIGLRQDSLRHVLLNLLDNAVKYGPAGQTIRVGVHRVDDDIQITVADEGPGVPRDERQAVWRPFARGESAREQGGSGIGLTIVRDVAAQHGGRAWVEGAPGGGARFIVALPITAASP